MAWIMGKQTLEVVLKEKPQKLQKVFTSKREGYLYKLCQDQGIPIAFKSERFLEDKTGSTSHQGWVGFYAERNFDCLESFLLNEKDRSLLVFCDAIQDPQNLGAILRAASCFGADGVIFSKNRCAPITASVSKASVGASETLPLYRVSNGAEALKKCQQEGYEIVGLDGNSSCDIHQFSFPARCVIVMGSEHQGIQPIIQKKLDHVVAIPQEGPIESLNVSQAASVALSQYYLRISPVS